MCCQLKLKWTRFEHHNSPNVHSRCVAFVIVGYCVLVSFGLAIDQQDEYKLKFPKFQARLLLKALVPWEIIDNPLVSSGMSSGCGEDNNDKERLQIHRMRIAYFLIYLILTCLSFSCIFLLSSSQLCASYLVAF